MNHNKWVCRQNHKEEIYVHEIINFYLKTKQMHNGLFKPRKLDNDKLILHE